MGQLDNDLMSFVGKVSDERQAGLNLAGIVAENGDREGLDQALRILGLKSSPDPDNPDHRNEFGRVLH